MFVFPLFLSVQSMNAVSRHHAAGNNSTGVTHPSIISLLMPSPSCSVIVSELEVTLQQEKDGLSKKPQQQCNCRNWRCVFCSQLPGPVSYWPIQLLLISYLCVSSAAARCQSFICGTYRQIKMTAARACFLTPPVASQLSTATASIIFQTSVLGTFDKAGRFGVPFFLI